MSDWPEPRGNAGADPGALDLLSKGGRGVGGGGATRAIND